MNALRPLVLALTVAGALMIPAREANAGLVYASIGSGVCKASNGVNTNLLYSQFNVKNISAGTQTVICNTPFLRESLIRLLPGSGYQLVMNIGSSTTTIQAVTCTAAVGHGGGGTAVQVTKTVQVSSVFPKTFNFTKAELKAFSDYDSLAVTCALPRLTSIGLFIAIQPELNALLP